MYPAHGVCIVSGKYGKHGAAKKKQLNPRLNLSHNHYGSDHDRGLLPLSSLLSRDQVVVDAIIRSVDSSKKGNTVIIITVTLLVSFMRRVLIEENCVAVPVTIE